MYLHCQDKTLIIVPTEAATKKLYLGQNMPKNVIRHNLLRGDVTINTFLH